jgi:hypothetical protein
MHQNLQTFTKAVHTLRNVALRVPPDAWDNASCCEGWSARDDALARFVAFAGRQSVRA